MKQLKKLTFMIKVVHQLRLSNKVLTIKQCIPQVVWADREWSVQ